MTNAQKQSLVNIIAQANGNLARLLPYPDDHFIREVDRLTHSLHVFRGQASGPVIHEESEDDDS